LIDKVKSWQHIFKLDPAKTISDIDLEKIKQSNTDALIVGGTDNIDATNVMDLMLRLTDTSLPVILEVSTKKAIIPGFDYYFIPFVLNSQEKKWMMDIHHHTIKEYKEYLDYVDFFVEGYCIFNEEAKVFQKTNCLKPTIEDAVAYAYMAENIFKLSSFYVEYSGMYGDIEVLKEVSKELNETLLFYGGGIKNLAQAKEMSAYADVIIVGNAIYEDINQALATTQIKK